MHKNICKIITCVSLVFSMTLTAAAQTDTIKSYIHYGPYEINMPFMLDSTDVNSKKFNTKSLFTDLLPVHSLSGRGAEIFADTTGMISLVCDSLKHNAGLLTFYINASRYCNANLTISGTPEIELFLNGTKQTQSGKSFSITLEPRHHTVNIKYIAKPADSSSMMSVILNTKSVGALAVTLNAERTFTTNDVIEGKRIASSTISPDGKYILTNYTETFTGGKRIGYAELLNQTKGSITRVTQKRLMWMPRSSQLYYTRDGADGTELVTVDPATLGEKVIAKGLPTTGFHFAPNEKFIIYSKTDNGPAESNKVKQVLEPGDRMPGWRNRSFLYKYDLLTGMSERLTFGSVSTGIQNISEDGSKLLFSSYETDFSEAPFSLISIFKMDLKTMDIDTVFLRNRYISSASFSPDASTLLVSGSANAFDGIGLNIPDSMIVNEYDTQLFVYDLKSKAARALTKEFDPSVKSYKWSTHDGQIYFTAENRDKVSFYAMNPSSGAIKEIKTTEEVVQSFSLSKSSSQAVYYGQGISNATRLYSLDLKRGKETLIEDLSKELMAGVKIGEAGDWNFTSQGGDTIYGRYYYPQDFDPTKKYPMIVYYYGGTNPTARSMYGGYSPTVFAGLGFVVYVIQPSGATGFGQEFAARHVNAWGKKTADEIIEGTLKFCDDHPFVERTKIGCVGASYGGFMTMYLQTVTDIFAAAISHAGISNISGYWGEGYWGYSYSSIASSGSYPWNAQWLYAGQSPLYNADKVKTPILFLHGTADTNVPTNQSMQMFVALKALGRETALVLVEGENHWIEDYNNRIRWSNTMYAWFFKWLKEEPEWWKSLYSEKNL